MSFSHSVELKETYDFTKLILDLIYHERYKWSICGDLKAIFVVLELQLEYTKRMCFLCLPNSEYDCNYFLLYNKFFLQLYNKCRLQLNMWSKNAMRSTCL